jgi:hypothetical protein
MHELKQKINLAFADYKKVWIKEFADSKEENRKFKLTNVMEKDADITKDINDYFLEAEDRMKKLGKRGIW